MKQLKIVFMVLLALLTIYSCSNDEESNQQPHAIYGTWHATSFVANESLFDANGDGQNSTELLDELPCRYSILMLKEDHTFYQENNSWYYDETFDNYGCSQDSEIIPSEGSWTANSDFTMLSLTIDGSIAFLPINFDGEQLSFHSSEVFINRNESGSYVDVRGQVFFHRID